MPHQTAPPIPRTMAVKVESGACQAAVALAAYRGSADGVAPDDQEAITDLIVDLLHLADREGIFKPRPLVYDATFLVDSALDHYHHEADPANAEEVV